MQRRLWDQTSGLEGAEISRDAWKRFGPTEAPGKDTLRPAELLQAVQCAPGSQLRELSPMLGPSLVIQFSLSRFCPCKSVLTHIPVSNPNKAHGSSHCSLVVSLHWLFMVSCLG